ncbi:hypothetical protein PYCCODRAFT_182237 [Trametes coccinea BRFM310]|uniref:Uncharacterized protein n=1 Tax=Trametes coccinea (strain BRFM310) TaxID=1353009 RepID=A0A1Y2IW13_TRAC3|nr:hypothetical protein PYCCODRAFT_182237 [Trametes coccinea BRFM310]
MGFVRWCELHASRRETSFSDVPMVVFLARPPRCVRRGFSPSKPTTEALTGERLETEEAGVHGGKGTENLICGEKARLGVARVGAASHISVAYRAIGRSWMFCRYTPVSTVTMWTSDSTHAVVEWAIHSQLDWESTSESRGPGRALTPERCEFNTLVEQSNPLHMLTWRG